MNKEKKIFKVLRNCTLLGLSLFVVALPAYADDNGCSDLSRNDRINPELALCSTHVYNIGKTTNPSSEADKQLMRDVVALKTTIITQQMEKQYDFLEATIKRLKTQLQKAVLTTNLEAAGASSSSSSGGIAGIAENGVSGAENCRTGYTSDVMNCLSRNLDRTLSAINNSDIGAAKQQIQTDLETMRLYDNLEKNVDLKDSKVKVSDAFNTAYNECTEAGSNRQDLNRCIDYMRVVVTRNLENLQRQNTSYGYNQMRY